MLTEENIKTLNAVLRRIKRGETTQDIAKSLGCHQQDWSTFKTVLRKLGVDAPKGPTGYQRSAAELKELRAYKAERERRDRLAGADKSASRSRRYTNGHHAAA